MRQRMSLCRGIRSGEDTKTREQGSNLDAGLQTVREGNQYTIMLGSIYDDARQNDARL